MLAEGDRIPELTLDSDTGKKIRLADLAGGTTGRQLVVYFYPKDDTPGCTREGIAFSQLASDFTRAGAVVVGISRDSVAAHGRFRDKHRLTIPLLADPDKAAHVAFGAWGEKVLYGKRSEGAIRCTFLFGPDGVARKVWKSVKVDGHAEQVLALVRGEASAPTKKAPTKVAPTKKAPSRRA